MSSTTRQITAGFGWVAVVVYANRTLGVFTTLILAKVLTPADFGLVAVASMLIEMLQVFRDMGLSEAVIYDKRHDPRAVDTAHTILVSYNVLLFLIAAGIAPLAARFYDNPTVFPLTVALSVNLVIDALRAAPRALFRRNLEYQKLLIPEVVPVAVSAIVSIMMALTGWGVWSLVAKTVLHSLLGLVLLQPILIYRPKFAFDRAAARDLFRYGRFIVGTTILLVALYNIDRFYISKLSGIAALGLYELAMRIAEMPVKQFSHLVGNVMFPVFSRMNRSGDALAPAFLKTLKYTASATVPMAIGLSAFGPALVQAVYGSQWEGLMVPLRILALYGVLRSLSSTIYDLFKGVGQPGLMQRFCGFKLLAIAGLGPFALMAFGLPGISGLIVLTYFTSLVFEVRRVADLVVVPATTVARVLVMPVLLATVIIPGVNLLAVHTLGLATVWHVLPAMLLAAIGYLAALWILDREVARDFHSWRAAMRPAPAPLETAVP